MHLHQGYRELVSSPSCPCFTILTRNCSTHIIDITFLCDPISGYQIAPDFCTYLLPEAKLLRHAQNCVPIISSEYEYDAFDIPVKFKLGMQKQ